MKKSTTRSSLCWLILFTLLSYSFATMAQSEKYVYEIDLQNVDKDRVKVTLNPPTINKGKAIFVMPSVIPGSYSKKDYGRFLDDFKAYDKDGNLLKVSLKQNSNFHIKGAKNLAKIEYLVNDTWDHENKDQWVFQPGGSNIEAGKNFSINHHAFFGYFEGYKNLAYELHFNKPAEMYGSTPLRKDQVNATKDVLYAENYVKLADNPVMYCAPDTVSYMANNTRVYFSVYSPQDQIKAQDIADLCRPLAKALEQFFGELPVDQYHFIFYFAGRDQNPYVDANAMAGFGALEHSYCSFYYLPEIGQPSILNPIIQDVSAHEFLHILTPLNIHSEEIENFNFRKPKMSQHLWMYEGVTEYFATLVQAQSGIISEEEFFDKIKEKIGQAADFDPISFTKMSKQILKDKYQDDYLNVYQKGALIGMGLDLELLRLSEGKVSLKKVMMDLAAKYGPNKPFKDTELIEEIIRMTYPEMRDFFNKYVIGKETIDYNKYLDAIGYQFVKEAERKSFKVGSFALGFDPEVSKLMFVQVEDNVLGIEENDKLVSINDTPVTIANVQQVVGDYLINNQSADEIQMTVIRGDKEVELSGKPIESVSIVKNLIEAQPEATEKQLKYRAIYFGQ